MNNSELTLFFDKGLRIRWELPRVACGAETMCGNNKLSCRLDALATVPANARTEAMTTPSVLHSGGSVETEGLFCAMETVDSDNLSANHRKTGTLRI